MAVVILLFALREMLEAVGGRPCLGRDQGSHGPGPEKAHSIEDDGQSEKFLRARWRSKDRPDPAGERVLADGEITDGASGLDERAITGESVPVAKGVGDRVFAGSVDADGALQVRVTRTAADNTIARILHLVEEAQASKSPTARFIDRFSAIYTPFPFAFSPGLFSCRCYFSGPIGYLDYRALRFFWSPVPALSSLTPAAIASGLAASARRGLSIKAGALETIGRVRTVAFDKTGTLDGGPTQGHGRPCLRGDLRAHGPGAGRRR